jgi:catechol 2,3-dioxygenase-like lactoylglutathione lyase family enzyme
VFDHVTLRVSDLDASREFYATALSTVGFGEPSVGEHFVEWNDLSISAAVDDRPLTRRAHIGCAAPSRERVDEFWKTLTQRGYQDDGPPGEREQYRPTYYGAFVLDPDGNSVEAVHKDNVRTDGWCIDHVWMRVDDAVASKAFYETIARVLSFDLRGEGAGWAHFRGVDASFTVTTPGEPTENLHLAFPAPNRAAVDEFHRVAIEAGYRDNGAPGERRTYHEGYYGAYVLDPDGNNVEAVFHDR